MAVAPPLCLACAPRHLHPHPPPITCSPRTSKTGWRGRHHAARLLLHHMPPKRAHAVQILAAAAVEVHSLGMKKTAVSPADLPYPVNDTITVESWGDIYKGPDEERYWNHSRKKKCHPYPVGYTATKVYKGRQFRQTVEAGPDGPLFLVMEIGGATCSSDSASKAWSQAIQNNSLRLHGDRHFGFDDPFVKKVLYDMVEECRRRESQNNAIHVAENVIEAEEDTDLKNEDIFVKKASLNRDFSRKEGSQAHERQIFLDEESCSVKQSGSETIQQAFQSSLQLEKDYGYKNIEDHSHLSLTETFETLIDSMNTVEGLIPDVSNIRSKDLVLSDLVINKKWTKEKGIGTDESYGIISRSEQFTTNPASELSVLPAESTTVEEGAHLIESNDQDVSILKQDTDYSRAWSSLTLLHKWNEVKKKKQISNEETSNAKRINSFLQVEYSAKDKVVDDAKQQKSVLGKQSAARQRQIVGHAKAQDKETGAVYKVKKRGSNINQEGKSGIGLVAEIKKLISDKKFKDAFATLRNLKLSGIEIDGFIYEAFFPFTFDLWQKQVRELLRDGSSVLVCAPGGAGKLAAAECSIYEILAKNHRALFVTPYEELAKQQFKHFQLMFGNRNVGAVWSRMEMQKDAPLVVVTLDTLVKIVREKNGPGGSEYCFFFEGISLAVFDKFHTIGDVAFGGLWEEVFMLMNPQIKFVALSLIISNVPHVVSWINSTQRLCQLVEYTSDPVPKRFLFGDGSGLVPLLDSLGSKMDSMLMEKYASNSCTEMKSVSSFCGYDRPSLRNVLGLLESKLMLPAVVIFFHHEECNTAFEDAMEVFKEGLLSAVEVADVERRLALFLEKNPGFHRFVDEADKNGLLYGLVTYHEGKIPLWLDFVDGLIKDNLVKSIITTHRSVCQADISGRSIIFPVIYRIVEDGISLISSSEFLDLRGIAGRRSCDTEGNVIFLKSLYSTPMEVVSLVLSHHITICSHFKPSYSLLLNLLAKYNLPKVKRILKLSLSEFIPSTHIKNPEQQETDNNLHHWLGVKDALEIDLFQELARINKEKLKNAAMFTRVDVRSRTVSTLESDNRIPAVLLAALPGECDNFYMAFCIDNQYRLLPAGAFDYVYTTEPTFDAIYKHETGQTLHTGAIPPKEEWTVDYEGGIGYIAGGNSESFKLAEMIKQHPIHNSNAKEVYKNGKQITTLKNQISKLRQVEIYKEWSQQGTTKAFGLQKKLNSSECASWKNCEILLDTLERADAFSFAENQVVYVKLKPLGVLISRLHHVENELWISMALSSDSVKSLLPAEFAGIAAALLPDQQVGPTTDLRELTYRVSKRLQAAAVELEALRKKVACIQASYRPSIHLNAAISAMVYSWARGNRVSDGFCLTSINDGGMVLQLKRVAAFTSIVYQACNDTSVDGSVSAFASVVKKAEISLARYLSPIY